MNSNLVINSKALGLLCAVLAFNTAHAAFNFEVSGVQIQLAGTTTDVAGSGTPSNFASSVSAGVNTFAVFDIDAVNDSDNSRSDFADLRVTFLQDNGGIGSNIMIARTTDSQGLTDDGTISVLFTIGNTSGGSAVLQFDWFTPGSFVGGVEQSGASLINTRINYTTFDIDFNQLVAVQNSEMSQYKLNGTTLVTATDNGTSTVFTDNGASSTFNDPKTAVEFLTRNIAASHTIEMGKQLSNGNALFMFEFRDPSDVVTFDDPVVTPVPELSHFGLLAALALSGFTLSRRKSARTA